MNNYQKIENISAIQNISSSIEGIISNHMANSLIGESKRELQDAVQDDSKNDDGKIILKLRQ
jgi:hypothetical protein